jgi:FMN phosphatase YigB (HAD superfamily)
MQPTGQRGRQLPLGHSTPVSALRNVGLCAGRLEGPQLIRMSLGGSTSQGGFRKRVIRTLICDLDNTLFPARTIPRAAVEPALERVRVANRAGPGIPDARLEEALEACWDRAFDEVARLYDLPEPLCQAWHTAAKELEVTGPLELYSDVDVLWALPLRRFLVTTGYRRFQESKISVLGLAGRFEAIYIDALGETDRVGKEALFRRILREQEAAAPETAVLGDSAEGELLAGESLGLWTIQILRQGVVPTPRAHSQVRSLKELPAVLAQASQARATT